MRVVTVGGVKRCWLMVVADGGSKKWWERMMAECGDRGWWWWVVYGVRLAGVVVVVVVAVRGGSVPLFRSTSSSSFQLIII